MTYYQRYEKKFFIDLKQEIKIKNKFKKIFNLEFDNGYYCYSIYFDDLNYTTLKQKQEGLTKRHKIRLRTYFSDLAKPTNLWNLEIKLKNNSIVKKNKKRFTNDEVMENLINRNYSFFSKMFAETSRKYYRPVYITYYFREAYLSNILPHCRLTFDKYIRCFKYNLDILNDYNVNKNYVLDPKIILLELKYSNFLPYFISSFFRYLNLEQVTFSKYVDGYEKFSSNPFNTANFY